MTAIELLRYTTCALYLVLFGSVLVRAIRAPRRRNVDIALFFGATTSIIVTFAARQAFGPSGDLASALRFVGIVVLMAVPYLFLRLARDFEGVPGAVLRAAEVGMIASVAVLAAAPLADVPVALVLLIGLYLSATLGYCAVLFAREAARARGVTRRRLDAVTIGSGALAVALLLLGVSATSPELAPVAAGVGQVAQLASAVAYFVGFAAPQALRRMWQEPDVRRFLTGVSRLSGTSDLRQAALRIEEHTAEAFGGNLAWLALRDPLRQEFRVLSDGAWLALPRDHSLADEVFAAQRALIEKDVIAAPATSGDRFVGVLAVGSMTSFFADDDLALLTVLAGQAAVVLENARLLVEIRELTDEAERHAAEMTTRLAAIVDSASDAIIGMTLGGTVTSWNRGAERLYGWTEAEMIGRSVTMLAPADRGDEIPSLLRHLRRGERTPEFDTERVRKDGSTVQVAMSISPVRDFEGAIVGAATIARDIGARVEAEREREKLAVRLRQSERMESLGRLAGGIAHDFNNILTIITSYADFALDNLEESHAARSDVQQIARASERAAAFIRQLLAFARRDPVHAETLRLGEVIGELHDMLGHTVPENVELRTQVQQDLWPIEADPGRIDEVLVNLAMNACDAMRGGGSLLIEAKNVDLDDPGTYMRQDLKPGPYVALTVTDTGSGMKREVLERAFEPFFTTKPPGEGTGLGLATVYGIATQAGGTVNLYSEPGRGTSVTVLLPAKPASRAGAAPPAETPQAAGRRATILVVEDEDAVREAARRILASAGYEVIDAPGPNVATEAAREHGEIDLLLTDMVMPEASGRELAERVRRIIPRLAVVYMSGYSEELVRAMERLDGPLVQKPFTRASLLATVGGVLAEADQP